MSATSMANVAIQRSVGPVQSTSRGGKVIAFARSADGEGATGSTAPPESAFTAAMTAVTTYIPTEILTLYLAGIAIYLGADKTDESVDYDRAWIIFIGALIATPIVNVLVFLAKLRGAQIAIPKRILRWPLWESVAATIAFVAIAATLPETPFENKSWYDRQLAGFLLGVVSLFLGLISAIVTPVGANATESADSVPGPLDELLEKEPDNG